MKQRRAKMKLWWVGIVISLVFSKWVNGFVEHSFNETELSFLEAYGESKVGANYLMVGLTLIPGAGAKRAGTLYTPMFFSILDKLIYILHIA